MSQNPTVIEAKSIREQLLSIKASGGLNEGQMRGVTDAISNLGICITMVELKEDKRHLDVLLPQFMERAKKLLGEC